MRVIEKQHLWLDNVVSYRTRVEYDRLAQLIQYVKTNMEVLDVKITGDIIFAVTEIINESDQIILGVEFIVPVDRRITSNCHIVFKPKFRLENALVLKFSGKISELITIRRSLHEYALNNNLNVLTDVYFEVKQFVGNDVVMNAYIGICGNSL